MLAQGYAVVWGDVADVDGHREQIARGAFRHASLTSLRVAHGAAACRRCRVWEDDRGLRFQAELDPSEQAHRRIAASIRDHGLAQVSIGYRALKSRWEGDLEIVEQARLLELSLTGDAAYGASFVEIVDGELPAWPDPPRAEQPAAAYAIWPQRLEPQALTRLARRDPMRAMIRAHMARYLGLPV